MLFTHMLYCFSVSTLNNSINRVRIVFVFSILQFCLTYSIFAQPTVTIEHGDLRAVFVNNSSFGKHHYEGYNGIAELYHSSQDSNLFVPSFAGINLEHIFGGDSLIDLFEPRKEFMTIKKLSNNKVQLHQSPTHFSRVESRTTFEMEEPNYINIEFSFIVSDTGFFKHGYVGLFWASYINEPGDIGIFFRGRKEKDYQEEWIYSVSPKHGIKSTHLDMYDRENFYFSPDFNVVLASGISEYVYSEPFYFGRFHNMVMILMFPENLEGFLRFSQSPDGAGEGKPAWDFYYIVPDFIVGKEYTLRWTLVYKEWEGFEDIAEQFLYWKSKNNLD